MPVNSTNHTLSNNLTVQSNSQSLPNGVVRSQLSSDASNLVNNVSNQASARISNTFSNNTNTNSGLIINTQLNASGVSVESKIDHSEENLIKNGNESKSESEMRETMIRVDTIMERFYYAINNDNRPDVCFICGGLLHEYCPSCRRPYCGIHSENACQYEHKVDVSKCAVFGCNSREAVRPCGMSMSGPNNTKCDLYFCSKHERDHNHEQSKGKKNPSVFSNSTSALNPSAASIG